MGRRSNKSDPAADLEAELSVGEGLKERTLQKMVDTLNTLEWTAPEQALITIAVQNLQEVIRQIGEEHAKAKD